MKRMWRYWAPLLSVPFVLGQPACNNADRGGASSIEGELKTMDATERQALLDLLKGTGVQPEGLRSIGIRGIDRNARAIAIEGGHVIAPRSMGSAPYIATSVLVTDKTKLFARRVA